MALFCWLRDTKPSLQKGNRFPEMPRLLSAGCPAAPQQALKGFVNLQLSVPPILRL